MEKLNFKVSLPVSILKEKDKFIAYTPALDLSTSGDSFDEVKKRFKNIVSIFLEELVKKNTLDKVLSDLGWKKIKKEWRPPVVVSQELESVTISV